LLAILRYLAAKPTPSVSLWNKLVAVGIPINHSGTGRSGGFHCTKLQWLKVVRGGYLTQDSDLSDLLGSRKSAT
jgi:hypothetical protein